MSNLLWAIQSNLGNAQERLAIQEACSNIGDPYIEIRPIPFSNEIPDLPTSQPTLFYGSARFTTQIHKAQKWTPGVFFDEEQFRFRTALNAHKGHMLNADAMDTTMRAFIKQGNTLHSAIRAHTTPLLQKILAYIIPAKRALLVFDATDLGVLHGLGVEAHELHRKMCDR